ncbi:MAG: epoxyalkane--coenzyme M transferase [Chromatiales bacterium]|jgi:5-methyltetrahydropteroyltriglutamate--homocysteine methyltransferase|nr:epoxyalkane--coenzyme M transferase [Chromatiales bacterium]
MQVSKERVLTTHVGSLPRSQTVVDVVFGREQGSESDHSAGDAVIASAIEEIVSRQSEVGIDIVSDGELSKISYATYIKDRLTGFGGESHREPAQDLLDFPGVLRRRHEAGTRSEASPPRCIGEVGLKDMQPLETDLANFRKAVDKVKPVEAFMNAAAPGVIALFQPNDYYPNHEQYVEALGEAMRIEYEGIVAAGFLLQIDSPDIGMGRHTIFRDKNDDEYLRLANLHIEVLNQALQNIDSDRVRLHVCWGNYEGPHNHDVPMELVLPIALKADAGALLFESSNPRHAHEWTVFRDTKIPDDLILVPGVIDSTTNFIEHPQLVAERICRFADIVGRERIIAGTDCGFGTFANHGTVDADVVFAKLGALAEGARIASDKLWA